MGLQDAGRRLAAWWRTQVDSTNKDLLSLSFMASVSDQPRPHPRALTPTPACWRDTLTRPRASACGGSHLETHMPHALPSHADSANLT